MTHSRHMSTLRARLLNSLRLAAHPLDAYGASRASGSSPMDCGRELFSMVEEGLVQCLDATGSANDLACRFLPFRDAAMAEHG